MVTVGMPSTSQELFLRASSTVANENCWKGNYLMKSKTKKLVFISITAIMTASAALLSGCASSSGRSSGMGGLFLTAAIVVGIAVLIAWLLAISMFIDAAKAKGYPMTSTGLLWFVGIFATPLAVGLYVAALPDKRRIRINETPFEDSDDEELPAI